MSIKILLVEDDNNLAFMLSENLEVEGYKVKRLSRGEDVLPAIRKEDISVILMDVDLAGELDGFEVAENVRMIYPQLPIIFTTGKTHFTDMERGFRLGKVDYQKKPFGARELIARLTNILERKDKHDQKEEYKFKGFSFNPINHILRIDTSETHLTKTENAFFTILCKNMNNVVKKEEIATFLWGEEDTYPKDHSLNNLTHKIRKYLQDNPYVELKTVSKVGYRLMEK